MNQLNRPATIPIGNAPCSWGTLELGGLPERRIGYQQMLDELAESGYAGTELGDFGFLPIDPAVLLTELQRRQLTMLGAFVPVPLKEESSHTAGEAHALRIARLLAAVAGTGDPTHRPFVVLADENGADPVRTRNAGRITAEMGLSEAEWRTFAQGAERIARTVREETGLPTVFHHHCAGYVETPQEIARLLELTDPSLLGLVFDTGHYAFGSGGCEEVMAGMERFGDRIWYVHFKDFHPQVAASARTQEWDYLEAVHHGIFCELGQGCIDFPAVIAWLQARKYQGWVVVEQDVLPGMGTPKESALRNREYLRSLGV